jgi:hypothetical protein
MKVAASRVKAKFLGLLLRSKLNREWLKGSLPGVSRTHDHSQGKDFSSTMFAMDFDWERIFLCIALMRGCPPRVA